MLIDSSYFTKGSRHILNATLGTSERLPNPNAGEVNAAINAYVEEYQEEFLTLMLGSRIGNKANAYLACVDEDGDRAVMIESYEELLPRLKESFADYVFFHILRSSQTQSTVTGLVRLKCANEYVAPIQRQVDVWNRMVDRNRRFAEWSQSEECPLDGIKVDEELLTKINNLNL